MRRIGTNFSKEVLRILGDPANVTTPKRACPYDSYIRAFSSEKGEKHRREAFMTIHKFARMIGVRFENEEARNSFLLSRMDLTRVEEQRRIGKDAFWSPWSLYCTMKRII